MTVSNNWIVTVTKPNGTKVVVDVNSTVQSTLGAVTTGNGNEAGYLGRPNLTYFMATDAGDLVVSSVGLLCTS